MIAKHVPMRSLGKSDFAGLAKYITDAQSKEHRLGGVQVTNCHAGTLNAAIEEILATQHLNTRAKGDKTYHLLVSFRAGESPTTDTLKAIEERICAGLGYAEHQRISAVHNDTDNLHLHLAINKIHPVRKTMHEPFQAYRTLGELCTNLEREYKLEKDNHEGRRTCAENRANDMERHAGIESLVSWIRRECLEQIRGAQSWAELHHVMQENGLELRVRANGFVIESGDGTMVKASTVARDLSKPSLEKRFGPFEPSPKQIQRKQARRKYNKRPIWTRINTAELYARYQQDQRNLTASRAVAWKKAKENKTRRIEAAKQSAKLRRTAIKLMGGGRLMKKVLYAQAFAALRKEIQSINQDYRVLRSRSYEQHRRRAWADWLKQQAMQGDSEALTALRAREAAGLRGDTFRAEGETQPGRPAVLDTITKKGTIIYRVGQSAVRDDGDRLQVSREAIRQGLQAALRLAMERYGHRIAVNGTAEFKARIIRVAADSRLPITFADPALERRRQALVNKQQENAHEQQTNRTDRGRADRRGISLVGPGTTTDHHGSRSTTGKPGKPDVGRIGRVPPPQSKNRLRTLSSLGMVRIASGIKMLLPGDVSGHMEHQRAQPDNTLRRGGFGPGVKPEAVAAADKYIDEREVKRLKGFDIAKHSRYADGDGSLAFAGVRNIDGQALCLLKRGEEIKVLPVDQATVRRLSRISIGDAVSVTPQGSIKTSKGKRR